MAESDLTFDLVVATVERVDELAGFLDSLEKQSYRAFRVVLVDQNDDDRLSAVVQAHAGLEIERVRARRGLSRARNTALGRVSADVVAFPDDDCVYGADQLERIAARLAARPDLDGLSGRAVDEAGRSSPSWAPDPVVLTEHNLWNRAVSFGIFLRRRVVSELGPFDEQLGLGAGTPWSSGEEIDYLVRAALAGCRIEYDPSLVVTHDEKRRPPAELRAVGYRDGSSVGYILRKHRYPTSTVARMLVRPVGGALFSLSRGDLARATFHLATLRGRAAGYVTSSANS